MIGRDERAAERPRARSLNAGELSGDLWLYLGSAVVAGVCFWSHLRTIHLWALMALPVYMLAAACSACMLRAGLSARMTIVVRWRVLAAVVLFAAVAPMICEVVLRWLSGSMWAQSEVLVIEQAWAALLSGHDPYGRFYSADTLGLRPDAGHHFPYMPAMAGFGIPHLALGTPLGDARIMFALTAAATAWYALAASSFDGPAKLRVGQVLFAIPPGSVAMTAGGDDLPVLAAMLLTVVLMSSDRTRAAGAAACMAALLKATAWPLLLPAAGLRAPSEPTRRWRNLAVLGGPLAAAVIFLVMSRQAWTDAILYPLGLGGTNSPAHMITLGGLTVAAASGGDSGPASSRWAAAMVVLIAVGAWVVLISRRPPRNWPDVLAYAAVLFILLIMADPIGRPGYFAYPMNMLCWRSAFLASMRRADARMA